MRRALVVLAAAAAPLVVSAFVATANVACEPPPARVAKEEPSASAAPPASVEITDVTIGTGPEAREGRAVSVHYVGRLKDGTVFDDSHPRGQPLTFIVGDDKMIKGWNKGIVGMKTGGVRKIVVPPELGYGDAGQPPKIPPNATLYFDLELVHVVE